MVFTAFQLGETTCSAPDVSKARVSAARIMTLLNRKKEPPLDTEFPDGPGIKPVGRPKYGRAWLLKLKFNVYESGI